VTILTRLLTGAVPLVVLALGVLTWWLTGRTLRPVEKMRVEMAEISGTNLDRRVAEPGTGDEIDRLAHTMNETLDRLESAIRRQRQFVGDASHELRSPLTRIRTELEIDLTNGQPVDPGRTERSVLADVIQLQYLVDDLLQLARSDDGVPDLQFQPVDLDDIVLREARRISERGRVTVDLHGMSAAQTLGDPQQLARAIRNLLENAERHAAAVITVILSEDDHRVRLAIRDDGAGISAKDRPHIFERFTRLDDARTRESGGSGLGLAIVRDIVERHGGTIRLDDGLPTQFVLELPLAGAAIVTAAAGDDTDTPITGPDLARASQAALAHTGQGRVTGTEVGDEESYYEVEVTLDNGSQVDVQLDKNFQVVESTSDRDDDSQDEGED
jgi:signal transduction histidine kinase